jgi:hypothetical protein
MLSPSPISFEGPFAYVPRLETHEGPSKPRLRDVEELLLEEDSLRTITVHIESPERVRLDQLATELARLACGALDDVRFTQLGSEDAPTVVLPDEHLTEDSAVIGLVRLTAMRGESCTEIFAIDRGPWVDLPALLGLLNTLLHKANSSRRYAVLRGRTSAARVLCEDERAIRASVQADLLELEDPDDALTRSYEDEPS